MATATIAAVKIADSIDKGREQVLSDCCNKCNTKLDRISQKNRSKIDSIWYGGECVEQVNTLKLHWKVSGLALKVKARQFHLGVSGLTTTVGQYSPRPGVDQTGSLQNVKDALVKFKEHCPHKLDLEFMLKRYPRVERVLREEKLIK